MKTRKEMIAFCLTFKGVYEDYPFHDDNWTVMRCKGNKKPLHIYMKETALSR